MLGVIKVLVKVLILRNGFEDKWSKHKLNKRRLNSHRLMLLLRGMLRELAIKLEIQMVNRWLN